MLAENDEARLRCQVSADRRIPSVSAAFRLPGRRAARRFAELSDGVDRPRSTLRRDERERQHPLAEFEGVADVLRVASADVDDAVAVAAVVLHFARQALAGARADLDAHLRT